MHTLPFKISQLLRAVAWRWSCVPEVDGEGQRVVAPVFEEREETVGHGVLVVVSVSRGFGECGATVCCWTWGFALGVIVRCGGLPAEFEALAEGGEWGAGTGGQVRSTAAPQTAPLAPVVSYSQCGARCRRDAVAVGGAPPASEMPLGGPSSPLLQAAVIRLTPGRCWCYFDVCLHARTCAIFLTAASRREFGGACRCPPNPP